MASYDCKVMLTDCFRVHPAILSIPNKLFYKDKMVSAYKAPKFHNRYLFHDRPIIFINVNSREEKSDTSYVNKGEVDIVHGLVNHLIKNKRFTVEELREQFGFVSPYAPQMVLLKAGL